MREAVGGGGRVCTNMPRSHEDLACDEEGDKGVSYLTEVPPAVQEVVFVASIGVALRVKIIRNEVQGRFHIVSAHEGRGFKGKVNEHLAACSHLCKEVLQAVTFGGGVLGM